MLMQPREIYVTPLLPVDLLVLIHERACFGTWGLGKSYVTLISG